MIEEGRQRLQQIRNKTYELNKMLWAALLTDDDATAMQDLEYATELSLEVAGDLLAFTAGDKHALAERLSALASSPSDPG